MTEKEIRAIVRDEIWDEANRDGGLNDHACEIALNMVQPIIDLKIRNLQEFFLGQVKQ